MKRFKKTLIPLLLAAGLLCAACTAAGPSMSQDPSPTNPSAANPSPSSLSAANPSPSASPIDTARHIKLSDAIPIQTPQAMPYANPLDIKEQSRMRHTWPNNPNKERGYDWVVGGFNPWWATGGQIDVWRNEQAKSAIARSNDLIGGLQFLAKDQDGKWTNTVSCQYSLPGLVLGDAQENDEYYILLYSGDTDASAGQQQIIAVSKKNGEVYPLISFDVESALFPIISQMKVIGNSIYYEELSRASDIPEDPMFNKCYPRLVKLDIQTLEKAVIHQFALLDYDTSSVFEYIRYYCYAPLGNVDHVFISERINQSIHVRQINLADPDEAEDLVFESENGITALHEAAIMDRFLVLRLSSTPQNGTYLYDPERGEFYALPPLSDDPYTILSNVIGGNVYIWSSQYKETLWLTMYRYDLEKPDKSVAVKMDIGKYAEGDEAVMLLREQDGKTVFTLYTNLSDPDDQFSYDRIYYQVTIDIP